MLLTCPNCDGRGTTSVFRCQPISPEPEDWGCHPGRVPMRRAELRRYFAEELNTTSYVVIDAAIKQALESSPSLTAEGLGKHLKLTYEKRKRHGITTIRCYDLTPAEVSERQKAERREPGRFASRRYRQRKALKKAERLSERARVIWLFVGRDWTPLWFIAKAVAGLPEFRSRRARRMPEGTMRQAVHRGIAEIECRRGAWLESKVERVSRNLVKFVRRVGTHRDDDVTVTKSRQRTEKRR